MRILILLAFVSAAHGLLGSWKPGLRVRFDIGLNIGRSFFFDIPRSVSDAKSVGWVEAKRPPGPLRELSLLCSSDHVLCTLYDDTEYVAGVQIALSKGDFTNTVFDMQVQGFTEWTATVDGVEKAFWTLQQYFVSEESLQKSKEERLAARNPEKTLQEGAVWVTGTYGELLKISTDAQEIATNSPFTKQSCIPWMGRHYYYNMTSSLECTAEQLFPWFPLVNSGELVGTGFMVLGKMNIPEGQINWFEDPTKTVVKVIVPNGPDCLYDLVGTAGAVTMHVYYIDKPWFIGCLFS